MSLPIQRLEELCSMKEFVFHLRNMTTSELYRTCIKNFAIPRFDNSDKAVNMAIAFVAVDAIKWKLTREFAKILAKPIKKGMFVPCDLDDNILQDPTGNGMMFNYKEKCDEWFKAKNRILFEGFEKCNRLESVECFVHNDQHFHWDSIKNQTIEYLSKYNLKITKTTFEMIFGHGTF